MVHRLLIAFPFGQSTKTRLRFGDQSVNRASCPCFLSFASLLLLSCSARDGAATQAKTGIPEAGISVPADSIPEYPTEPHVIAGYPNQISGVVRRIFQDRSGNLWFGTQNGACRYDGTALTYFAIRDEYDQAVTIKSIVEDGKGDIWLGSTGGLTRYDGEYFTNFTTADGLISNDVWCLCVDRTGTLWIGTSAGACRFDGETFTPVPVPAATEQNPNRAISTPLMIGQITEDRRGNLWISAQSGLYKYDGKSLARVSVMEEESETRVNGVLEDRNGRLWITTQTKGVIRYDGEVFTNISRAEGLMGTDAWVLYEDRAGNIWFTVKGAGVYRCDGTTYTLFSADMGLPSTAVMCILEDNRGRVWFGGWLGAFRYDGESVVNVTRDGPW